MDIVSNGLGCTIFWLGLAYMGKPLMRVWLYNGEVTLDGDDVDGKAEEMQWCLQTGWTMQRHLLRVV